MPALCASGSTDPKYFVSDRSSPQCSRLCLGFGGLRRKCCILPFKYGGGGGGLVGSKLGVGNLVFQNGRQIFHTKSGGFRNISHAIPALFLAVVPRLVGTRDRHQKGVKISGGVGANAHKEKRARPRSCFAGTYDCPDRWCKSNPTVTV